MQLYSFFNSSTSYRVRIALALKEVAYDYRGVNIRSGEQRQAGYVELNPAKGVPVLVSDDGGSLTQSMAIVQYLDDTLGGPRLIPNQPLQKARVLELANAIACDMHPVNNLKVLGYLTNNLGISEEQKKTWYAHWVAEGFSAVEALLERYGSQPYCFGDQPTLADCCLVPQVANALRMGCDLSPYPRVMSIYEHCRTQPAFIQAEPARQPDYVD
ncbi:glutathione-S-transferase [Marinobacterium zhoushanense]|uniref:Glutathione-S-transferase n=1 Tax=Marinobacterium zhoushanense TaxID=1679163 RepID=A0ABQ1K0Q2_9GAMM|nr:maleylacetoacetate isomerase [Marinobacterium zhoushanense]GGB79631.1 glutathione-S-transferase [Marinobacterium zhoushanense]